MSSYLESTHSRWLDAYVDSARITTLTQCMTLAANEKDGARLIVVDFRYNRDDLPPNPRPRLKFYSGISLMGEQTLPSAPSGVAHFNLDKIRPITPAVAVTCTSDILVFRNNKPYYKFSLPSLPVNTEEEAIWRNLTDVGHTDDLNNLLECLSELPRNTLTARSLKLINTSREHVTDFIQTYASKPLEHHNIITCMTTVLKKENTHDSISWLVLGTEFGDVYIIDTQGFVVAHQARVSPVKSTPMQLTCVGQYEVDFKCFVACRERVVCLLRRGWLEGRVLFKINGTVNIVAMVVLPGELNVVVGLSNGCLACYDQKGRRLWNIEQGLILTIAPIPIHHLNLTLIAVAVKGGPVRLFKDRNQVDTIFTPKDVTAIKFGPLGQEDNTLVLVTVDGSLIIKILKRTADFNLEMPQEVVAPVVKNLKVPKKTKLFLEQANRERQNALEIHAKFQQSYLRMRLEACQLLLKTMEVAENTSVPVRLSAEVTGLGPKYTLTVFVENMSVDQVFFGLNLLFHASSTHYKLTNAFLSLPAIANGITYQFETQITELFNLEPSDDNSRSIQCFSGPPIKVFVVKRHQIQPLLAATIHMPVSEIF